MTRGTTPTFKIRTNGVDPSTLESYYICFSQDGTEKFSISDDTCSIKTDDDGKYIEFTLTQHQTLQFEAGLDVDIQLRAITSAGKAAASPILTTAVFPVLHEGIIS